MLKQMLHPRQRRSGHRQVAALRCILAHKIMILRAHVELQRLEREQRIARYCAGRMGGDEATTFESEFLADAVLATDVERTLLLRDALQEHVGRQVARATPARHWPWLSLAAGIVIGAVGIRVMTVSEGGPQVVDHVEFLTLGVVRSAEPVLAKPTLQVDTDSLLIVEVPAESTIEAIELVDPNGQHTLVHGTRDQGFLRIALSPPIRPGAYTIVSGTVQHAFQVESGAR